MHECAEVLIKSILKTDNFRLELFAVLTFASELDLQSPLWYRRVKQEMILDKNDI